MGFDQERMRSTIGGIWREERKEEGKWLNLERNEFDLEKDQFDLKMTYSTYKN